MSDAYIFDALRTPRGRGKTNGSFYEIKPLDVLGTALENLRTRNGLNTKEVDDAIIGCVTPTDDQGFNIAKAGDGPTHC
jgi:acetyl-CoA C-acetyltransferase